MFHIVIIFFSPIAFWPCLSLTLVICIRRSDWYSSFYDDPISVSPVFCVFSPQQTMEWRAPVLCWTQGRTSDTSGSPDISATAGWTFSSVIVLSWTGLVASYLLLDIVTTVCYYRNFHFPARTITQAWPEPAPTPTGVITTKHHHFSYASKHKSPITIYNIWNTHI